MRIHLPNLVLSNGYNIMCTWYNWKSLKSKLVHKALLMRDVVWRMQWILISYRYCACFVWVFFFFTSFTTFKVSMLWSKVTLNSKREEKGSIGNEIKQHVACFQHCCIYDDTRGPICSRIAEKWWLGLSWVFLCFFFFCYSWNMLKSKRAIWNIS